MTDYEDIAGGGSFAKFDDVGDKVEGTVIACGIDTATDFDQNPVPGIDVDTADGIVTTMHYITDPVPPRPPARVAAAYLAAPSSASSASSSSLATFTASANVKSRSSKMPADTISSHTRLRTSAPVSAWFFFASRRLYSTITASM